MNIFCRCVQPLALTLSEASLQAQDIEIAEGQSWDTTVEVGNAFTLTGVAGNDILFTADTGVTFTIDCMNAGQMADSMGAVIEFGFLGIENVIGGAGNDTLNELGIFTDAMPTTLFRYTNFETVNGEEVLLANLPVIRMETTETGGAMRTLIAYVNDPSQGMMPDPDAMGGTDGTDGDADMMGGGQPDSGAGTGGSDTDTATPPPPADNVQIAAELSRTYGGEITPLNTDGDAPGDVNAYLFVDPTGPVPGGGGSRRSARPVQLAGVWTPRTNNELGTALGAGRTARWWR